MGGNIIWATDFREETKTTTQGGGKGGGGGKVKTTEYLYYASFAVALCEGPITGIGRIWADGKPMDLSGVTWRWYPGDEAQTADPFIAARMGAANTPAYRGTAYVVFEELALSTYGNRLPQLSFEVFRPLADPDTAEGLTRAVTMIPASGEFTYATQAIRKTDGGATVPENLNALADSTDMVEALDRLQAMAPAVESVSLVVAWFGDDLRAGSCKVRPGVEVSAKSTTPASWSVNGVSRASAFLVSRDAEDRPVYGGTPSDFAVVQAVQEMKARGLRVTFYPFILMDVPPGNTLPNPYSDNAAETGQPVFPWRGRITCSPAAGFAGTVDKTATAASQVAALFGSATPASFSVSGESVFWTGPSGDWGLRRMVLHYAHLCAAAGGVDAFLIGTEMPGLTTIRSNASTYPAVQAYRDLLADVRSILGPGTKIGYAADWSEYFGHQPGDGSGDVFFHLDPLWADPELDFVGIDNYMPLSDWRDGFDHADAAEGWPAIYDRAYLQANIAGGEGFDWFYASAADRTAQVRTPITDGAAAKPWVFRYKDLRAWWSNPHYDRPGGVEVGTPTAWVPESKPIWFGMLVSDFYAGPTSRFDLGNALVVDLLTGTLESVTDLTLFGGANALAIESAPGVWEIVQAGAAELLAPGRYRLTRLLRGQRGTEGAMGNPAPAGARVVVLDTALASLPIAEADLGIPWNWRIGPASRPVSDETYVAQAFTPDGVGLRPFSVAHVEQPWRKPRTSGDLTIRWLRRSRALAADSWGGLEVPLAEELEAYEVEILDGATVKRVLSTATTSVVYTAADQTADWGGPLGPGDTLDVRIFQLSALVGRGAPKTVTLIL